MHDGHRALFAQAKEHGEVYVVLSRDDSIRRLKKREPRMCEQERCALVQAEPTVHKALLGAIDDFFLVVEQERPDVLLLGYDQQTFSEENIRAELSQRGLSPRILRAQPFNEDVLKSSKFTRAD